MHAVGEGSMVCITGVGVFKMWSCSGRRIKDGNAAMPRQVRQDSLPKMYDKARAEAITRFEKRLTPEIVEVIESL